MPNVRKKSVITNPFPPQLVMTGADAEITHPIRTQNVHNQRIDSHGQSSASGIVVDDNKENFQPGLADRIKQRQRSAPKAYYPSDRKPRTQIPESKINNLEMNIDNALPGHSKRRQTFPDFQSYKRARTGSQSQATRAAKNGGSIPNGFSYEDAPEHVSSALNFSLNPWNGHTAPNPLNDAGVEVLDFQPRGALNEIGAQDFNPLLPFSTSGEDGQRSDSIPQRSGGVDAELLDLPARNPLESQMSFEIDDPSAVETGVFPTVGLSSLIDAGHTFEYTAALPKDGTGPQTTAREASMDVDLSQAPIVTLTNEATLPSDRSGIYQYIDQDELEYQTSLDPIVGPSEAATLLLEYHGESDLKEVIAVGTDPMNAPSESHEHVHSPTHANVEGGAVDEDGITVIPHPQCSSPELATQQQVNVEQEDILRLSKLEPNKETPDHPHVNGTNQNEEFPALSQAPIKQPPSLLVKLNLKSSSPNMQMEGPPGPGDDERFVDAVKAKLKSQSLWKTHNVGRRQARRILELLDIGKPPDASEALFASGEEAAQKLSTNELFLGPIITSGQQPLELQTTTQFLDEYYDDNASVFIQDPSTPLSRNVQQVREVTVGQLKRKFADGSKNKGKPWNCLELATHVEDGLRPQFLNNEDCRLLTKLKHPSNEDQMSRRGYDSGWKEIEKWALIAQAGALTEPHQDSHGYSTYITVNEGIVGFGWLSNPTPADRKQWCRDPAGFTGGKWRYIVLRPGNTVYFPGGIVHFVFRLATASDTLAFGGHVLRCSQIVHWVKTMLEEKRARDITNEDLTVSAPAYLERVEKFVKQARRMGHAEKWGGQEAITEFLRLKEQFMSGGR